MVSETTCQVMREMSEIGMRDLHDWPFFTIGLLVFVPLVYFWCLAVYQIIELVAHVLDWVWTYVICNPYAGLDEGEKEEERHHQQKSRANV